MGGCRVSLLWQAPCDGKLLLVVVSGKLLDDPAMRSRGDEDSSTLGGSAFRPRWLWSSALPVLFVGPYVGTLNDLALCSRGGAGSSALG